MLVPARCRQQRVGLGCRELPPLKPHEGHLLLQQVPKVLLCSVLLVPEGPGQPPCHHLAVPRCPLGAGGTLGDRWAQLGVRGARGARCSLQPLLQLLQAHPQAEYFPFHRAEIQHPQYPRDTQPGGAAPAKGLEQWGRGRCWLGRGSSAAPPANGTARTSRSPAERSHPTARGQLSSTTPGTPPHAPCRTAHRSGSKSPEAVGCCCCCPCSSRARRYARSSASCAAFSRRNRCRARAA